MTTEELARDLRHIARTLPGGHAADVCAAAADRLVTQQSVIGSLQSMVGAEVSARHKLEVDRQGFKTVSVQDMDAIRQAADTLVASVGQRADAIQLTDEQGKPQ
jgi:hypothetical protein